MASKSEFGDKGIESMYESVLHSCAACGKVEPDTKAFPVCSKCKLVFYCGRDCQVQHWKTHKKLCKKKKVLSVGEQLEDFKNQLQPMLMTMTMWSLYRYYGNDFGRSYWRGNTHMVLAKLKDSPPNSPIAFEISGLDVVEIRKMEGLFKRLFEKVNLRWRRIWVGKMQLVFFS